MFSGTKGKPDPLREMPWGKTVLTNQTQWGDGAMPPPARGAFANDLHQLLVSVSRRLYVTSSGLLKEQKKPVQINLKNCHRSRKEHLVYYLLRDDWSGNFTYQVATTRALLPMAEFLHWGWRKEDAEEHFWGLPRRLSVPKTVSSVELLRGLERAGVQPFHPASGFTSGVRALGDLEKAIGWRVFYAFSVPGLETLEGARGAIYRSILELDSQNRSKAVVWEKGLPPGEPRVPPSHDEFLHLFDSSQDGNRVLPLVKEPERRSRAPREAHLFRRTLSRQRLDPEKLSQAQDLIYEAWEARMVHEVRHKACRALEVSPFCADGYNLLADTSENRAEKLRLYEKAREVGEIALGPSFFPENVGSFWLIIEARPYMRALAGKALTLWETGERGQALTIAREMLRLNSGDNQGMRYKLVSWLLEEGCLEEAGRLLEEHAEGTCFMLYARALWLFATTDAGGIARRFLNRAVEANPHVPPYLLGEKIVPIRLPPYYSWGDENEAIIYAAEAINAWRETAGALDWMREVWEKDFREGIPGEIQWPVLSRVLEEFIKEKESVAGSQATETHQWVLELLRWYLEGYGHLHMREGDTMHFNDSFCDQFGPELIPRAMGEFWGHFLSRKVTVDQQDIRHIRETMDELGRWLVEKEYVDEEAGEDMGRENAEASGQLPRALQLQEALFDYRDQGGEPEGEEELDDIFEVLRVEPGWLYLENPEDPDAPVALAVSRRVSSLCREGWRINLLLVKSEKGWMIEEVGGVHVD